MSVVISKKLEELVRDGHREACGPSSVFRVLDPTRGRVVSRGQNESGTLRKGTRNPSREMINRVEMKAKRAQAIDGLSSTHSRGRRGEAQRC